MRPRVIASVFAVAAISCLNLPARPPGVVEFWGFTGPWDERSHESVRAHSNQLARVITGWITLDSLSFRPIRLYHDDAAGDPQLAGRTMALITTYEGSRFHPEVIRGLGTSDEAAALTAGLGFWQRELWVGGEARPVDILSHHVEPEAARVLGLRLQRGRWFDAGDVVGSPRVVVVDANLAARLWPGGA